MNSLPRVYLERSSFLSVIPVVRLHLHPPEIITFFPGFGFFSNIWIWKSVFWLFSRIVAAVMSPAAHAPMIEMIFIKKVYGIFLERNDFFFFCHLFSIYSSYICIYLCLNPLYKKQNPEISSLSVNSMIRRMTVSIDFFFIELWIRLLQKISFLMSMQRLSKIYRSFVVILCENFSLGFSILLIRP